MCRIGFNETGLGTPFEEGLDDVVGCFALLSALADDTHLFHHMLQGQLGVNSGVLGWGHKPIRFHQKERKMEINVRGGWFSGYLNVF